MRRVVASLGLALTLTGCLFVDGGGHGDRRDAIRACERKAERNGYRVRDIIDVDRLNENRVRVSMRVERRNRFLRVECTYNERNNEAQLD
jgi:hypothetical protein